MERLKVFFKLLSFSIMYCIIYTVQIFFPFYIAYVYKYAKKARSKIYTKWVVNKYFRDRFEKVLLSNYGIIDKVSKLDDDIFKFNTYIYNSTEEPIKHECKLKVYLDNSNSKYLEKLDTNIFKYCWYYYTIWMWLDDENNINGIDRRILDERNDLFKHLKGVDRFNIIDGNKLYTNVFSLEYTKDDKVVDFNRRFYFTKYITLNNYMRDKGTYSKSIMLGKYFGFKYNSRLNRNTIILFGKDILERNYKK